MPGRWTTTRTIALAVLVSAALCGAAVSAAAAPPVRLKVTGPQRVPLTTVRAAIGAPPKDATLWRPWAAEALHRVRVLYRKRGYNYARAWYKIGSGEIAFDVDEGRMQLVVVGSNAFRKLLFSVDLYLPGKIYHRPTVRRSLREIKSKYKLTTIYHRVVEAEPPVHNGFRQPVPQRQLRIYIITKESFGWGVSVSINSTWGILPALSWSRKGLILDDDRFRIRGAIGFPYRRYLFEESARFQWVHGRADLSYRLPPAWKSRIAPTIDGSTALSRYGRGGVAVERYMRFKVDGFASMALLISPLLTVKLGGGVDYAKPFDIAMTEIEVPEGAEPREREPVENSGLLRALSRVEASFNFDRRVLRRDQRDELRMLLKAGSSPTGAWIVDWRFWSQVISNFGPHELVLRSRGVFLAGDVKFWEEVPLASSYQRAYFGNRFWVRQALQISVAGRFALGRTIKVGLFHDLSAFFDRSRLPEESDLAEALGPLAFANGFGPSLHFLLFDHFALDLFYAFGFAPGGFDHNFSLRMQSAF